METKHTKGEWKVDASEEFIIRVVSPWSKDVTSDNFSTFADYRGAHICEMHYNTGVPKKSTAIANAKLIAAAPELLAFAIEMVERYPNSPWIYEQGNAAIKKATE